MDSGASDDDDQQRGEPPPHYAAHLDDRDRAYVAGLLRNREPLTDATLSCPSCFTTVCYECQRHVAYPTQYRALVSVHTRVLYDKALLYQVPPEEGGGQERYHPVQCVVCRYACGVYGPDGEDTYHFYDVLAGPAARVQPEQGELEARSDSDE